ncbi:unnamed protein product [Laminaria digitata]
MIFGRFRFGTAPHVIKAFEGGCKLFESKQRSSEGSRCINHQLALLSVACGLVAVDCEWFAADSMRYSRFPLQHVDAYNSSDTALDCLARRLISTHQRSLATTFTTPTAAAECPPVSSI